MKLGPDVSRIAALLGEPARGAMLSALMGGQWLTAGELAREAGITPQTGSVHLARLEEGGLLARRIQGRHNYFALSGPEVAEVLEQLAMIAVRAGHLRTRLGPKEPAMRRARVCYDHLAGDAGVAMLDALIATGRILNVEGSLVMTQAGQAFAREFGVAVMPGSRRPLCKACLDWSVRRSHMSGVFGAALLARIYDLGWARRMDGSRVVTFSAPGLSAFEKTFARLPQSTTA